jgi:hypothetical protein
MHRGHCLAILTTHSASRSDAIISGNFESRFKQLDESRMNAAKRADRRKSLLSRGILMKRRFADLGEMALTVPLESGVTISPLGSLDPRAVGHSVRA